MVEGLENVTHAVRELARCANPEDVSWNRLKQEVVSAATLLRYEAGERTPRVDVEAIAAVRHIVLAPTLGEQNGAGLHGVLAPTPEGFVMRVPEVPPLSRRRFTIAHEIGHTFFYDVAQRPPRRLLVPGGSFKEEQLCDSFAEELLVPCELLIKDSRKLRGFGPGLISQIAYRYGVSTEVALRRAVAVLPEFGYTVAIFRTLDTRSRSNPRLFRGGKVRTYLRKAERSLLASITDIVARIPSGGCSRSDLEQQDAVLLEVEQVAVSNRRIAVVECAIQRASYYHHVLVLVRFNREK